MIKYKKIIFIIILLTVFINISGCTYIEINDLPLILGAAIDKGKDGKYILTIEVFKPTAPLKEKESQINTEIVQTEGTTVEDAIRNLIIKLGKRGYWTHLKALIISKDIAMEGISPIMDFWVRNVHMRKEFPLLISIDETAYNIFYQGNQTLSEPVSNFINNTIKSVDKISKYDYVKFYEFINEIRIKGNSAVLPLISTNPDVGKKMPSISGVGVFKEDKMIGTLSPSESQVLRILKNKEKGGLLVVQWVEDNELEKVTLTIFKNKTKLEPLYNDKFSMNIDIKTSTEIVEIMNGDINVLDEKGREKLKKEAENKIKTDVTNLLNKLQNDYRSDAIGIGKKIMRKYPSVWEKYESNWYSTFATIPFKISVNVNFKQTGTVSEEIRIKE